MVGTVSARDTVMGKTGLISALIQPILRIFQSSFQIPFPFLCVLVI